MNIQKFSWRNLEQDDLVDFRLLFDFLLNCPCLQYLDCLLRYESDSVIQFVFCDAQEQGIWKDIRTVKVEFWGMKVDEIENVTQKYEHAQHVERWWKEFTFSSSQHAYIVYCTAFMASM